MNLPMKKISARDVQGLVEVRREISRLNAAAGETIFNPAATQALNEILRKVR